MYKKKKLIQIISTLQEANEDIRNRTTTVVDDIILVLTQCQELAIKIGTDIEEREDGLGKDIVHSLEEYCEQIYQLSLNPLDGSLCKKITRKIRNLLTRINNAILNDLPKDKLNVVFFPYMASMWDSLESIWIAAKEDENCNAIVVPIPYYEKNRDGSFMKMHYEGNDYPDYVPIVPWEQYDLQREEPEVVYIHNPYDEYNHVTSVHPQYYSRNIKQHTDCLVYVPYYSTSGGMSEGQRLCPSYFVVDYIIIQAPKFRDYFDESIPDHKFLPFGSPKFDRVIRKSKNPTVPPAEWKDKMAGKKVYFYNTSINGMLENTPSFLEKIEYVFNCFKDKESACLLWRSHPLLESTFDSMRPQYKPYYEALKRRFVDENLGIYDTTLDVSNTVALCDAYIGDAATSITSLFGVAGKPLFILNNYIHSAPLEDDWRGEIITGFNELNEDDRWMVTQGNKLYYSKLGNYNYHYYCDLSEYSARYYSAVKCFEDKVYVCPVNAQDILLLRDKKVIKRIKLERRTEKGWVFAGSLKYKNCIILIPANYGAVVIYDNVSEQIKYITEGINVFVRETQEGLKIGGYCIYNNYLMIASPVDDYIYTINLQTEEIKILKCGGKNKGGCSKIVVDKEDIWVIPRSGSNIKKWNPITGELHEYEVFPDELKCIHPIRKTECSELPFGNPAITADAVYLPQYWGNIHARIDKKSGLIEKWKPHVDEKSVSDYFVQTRGCYYIKPSDSSSNETYRMYSITDRSLYDVDLKTGKCNEIDIVFDKKELTDHESGFSKYDEWLQYCGRENAFNSLEQFLTDTCVGGTFKKEEQIIAYRTINANPDGRCGEKVHEFTLKYLQEENLWQM